MKSKTTKHRHAWQITALGERNCTRCGRSEKWRTVRPRHNFDFQALICGFRDEKGRLYR